MNFLPSRPTLAMLFVATLALGACGGDSDSSSVESGAGAVDAAATVTIETFDFQPDPLVVPAGTTITFVNRDKIDPTVTAGTRDAPEPGVFNGQLPEQGATFELTLDEPGSHPYFCTIHPGPGMTGTITVE